MYYPRLGTPVTNGCAILDFDRMQHQRAQVNAKHYKTKTKALADLTFVSMVSFAE